MRNCLAFWKKRNLTLFLIIFIPVSILFLPSSTFSKENVQYLKKVGEIKEGFSSEKENFFIKITGVCCDDEGNLYVADSGWNKIFKFDQNGKFIMSFGRQGQGPGEFMGHPKRAHLKISFGNDEKIYVNDPGNGRLSIFSKDGKFLKSFKLPPFTYDTPVVNSKGDIYLLSKSGIKVIDCYDSNFKYKASLLDMDEHLKFPFGKPSAPISELRKLVEYDVMKTITKNDNFVLISNYSLKAFVFDGKSNLINVFNVFPQEFKKDYEMQIKKIKAKEKMMRKRAGTNALWTWTDPFHSLFADPHGTIGLLYIKMDGEKIICKYNLKGEFLGKIICPGSSIIWAIAVTEKSFFLVEKILKGEEFRIGIYKLEKNN